MLELAALHPEAAFANPSLDLLLLEDAALLERATSSALCAIARSVGTPDRWLRALSRLSRADVRSAVAQIPSAPPDLVEELTRDRDPTVRLAAARAALLLSGLLSPDLLRGSLR